MSEGLINAAKFALTGVVVGVGTAYAADQVSSMVLSPLLQAGPSMSSAGVAGRLAFQVVACSVLAGGMIYLGDGVMDAVGPAESDPLFRLFFYYTAFNTMATAQNAASGVIGLIRRVSSGVSSASQASASGGVSQAPPAPSCSSGSCGN